MSGWRCPRFEELAASDFPIAPIVGKRKVITQKMLPAAVVAAADVFFRDVMAAESDPQGHSADGLGGGTDQDVMQDDAVAFGAALVESAKRAAP